MKKYFILGLCIIFASIKIYSQNEIWLMDGKKINAIEIKIDTTDFIKYQTVNGKIKEIDKFDVFSVKIKDETQYFYKPDTLPDSFTINQMQDYLQGRNEGRYKKEPLSFAGGVVTGVGAPLLFPIIGISTYLTPIIPAAYDVTIGLCKVKDEKIEIAEEYKSNPYYIEGYKASVKKKKINNAIFGSLIGLTVGLTASYLIFESGL